MPVKVVHCSTYEVRPDELYVYIGRPTVLGNPFVVGVHGQRGECVDMYRVWLKQLLKVQPGDWSAGEDLLVRAIRDLQLAHLEGIKLVLGCYCKPRRCHGDVLQEIIESVDVDDADARLRA